MRGERDITDYLRDILDAAQSAEEFLGDMQYQEFIADKRTVFAVVRALEIVGEATRRIPDSVRQRYPDIPWRRMTGTRDRLSHDYRTWTYGRSS